ncbi:DUF2065 family protein [Rhodobacteraceae bacterium]|nr:DUF2065 family protein [Paracoccaceae bacterium]
MIEICLWAIGLILVFEGLVYVLAPSLVEAGVTHVIAREIEDISPLLDHLLTQDKAQGETHSA